MDRDKTDRKYRRIQASFKHVDRELSLNFDMVSSSQTIPEWFDTLYHIMQAQCTFPDTWYISYFNPMDVQKDGQETLR
jgi:hypothetical protein